MKRPAQAHGEGVGPSDPVQPTLVVPERGKDGKDGEDGEAECGGVEVRPRSVSPDPVCVGRLRRALSQPSAPGTAPRYV